MNDNVCPTDAISIQEKSICIDNNKCIGCGLCAVRCPVGAIYIKNGKASLNVAESYPNFILEHDLNPETEKMQETLLKHLVPMHRGGIVRKESDNVMADIYSKITNLHQDIQNLLVRNLLITIGNQASISRLGNVYSRFDGFYENEKQKGVLEIETGTDMLAVSRTILDDIAVINVRYNISSMDNKPLAVVLSLPNKRTDYWQVIKDIKNVTNICICTLTFGALLLFTWNCEDVSDFQKFYIDVDNSSLRRFVEEELGRKVNISDGVLGVLENSK